MSHMNTWSYSEQRWS